MWTNLKNIFFVAAMLCVAHSIASGQDTTAKVTDASQQLIAKTNVVFEFQGGPLSVFIYKIRERFGVDLDELATIPQEMGSVKIPKMRIVTRHFENVLNLYNEVSHKDEDRLGKWAITRVHYDNGGEGAIGAIQLIPGPSTEESGKLAVQAFFLPVSEKALSSLTETIDEERTQLGAKNPGGGMDGRLEMHENTHILVVTGTRAYVDLVSAIIRAYKEGPPFFDKSKTP